MKDTHHHNHAHEHSACACQAGNHKHDSSHDHSGCGCGNHNGHACGAEGSARTLLIRAIATVTLLVAGILTHGTVSVVLLIAAYLAAGYDVLLRAMRNILHGEIFDENFLMAAATIGAVCIGESIEAAAVMALYQLGEYLQHQAVDRSRKSITSLMALRPDFARVVRSGETAEIPPEDVQPDDVILVRPGERIPLDGVVLTGESSLNTAALTGESLPRDVCAGCSVLSGCVNLSGTLTLRVTGRYEESTAARILRLAETAGEHKASTEQFITRFSRRYTPMVCGLALLLAVIPPLFDRQWTQWLHRALTFLVISCPCALVISVPLTFFSGMGRASRRGVLVKGANHLESLARLDTLVMDKTGTVTKGNFAVVAVTPCHGDATSLLETAALAETHSNHPISLALRSAAAQPLDAARVTTTEEMPGMGIKALVDGRVIHAGNARLMSAIGIVPETAAQAGTTIHVAEDGLYLGYIVIADELKPTAIAAMKQLRSLGINRLVMLTGDSTAAATETATMLGITEIHAELMPEGKVTQLENLLAPGHTVAFVGDGMNDAPVLRRADVGIAMGGVGSDAAMEAADVVLMNDDPLKLAEAVCLSRRTVRIARQNIVFALAVKMLVMLLGALGYAGMGAAVFADVGVTLLAILNAIR